MTDRELIEAACTRAGLMPDAWDEGGENGLTARFDNNWFVVNENEDQGLYAEDIGKLSVYVAGAAEYDNQRAVFAFTPEGSDPDSGPEVRPFEDIEVVE